jgi:hypothetical protein
MIGIEMDPEDVPAILTPAPPVEAVAPGSAGPAAEEPVSKEPEAAAAPRGAH